MNYPYSQPLTWHAKAFGEAGRGAAKDVLESEW